MPLLPPPAAHHPKEEPVFRAVLLLLNELSPSALNEVKLYIAEKERAMKR